MTKRINKGSKKALRSEKIDFVFFVFPFIGKSILFAMESNPFSSNKIIDLAIHHWNRALIAKVNNLTLNAKSRFRTLISFYQSTSQSIERKIFVKLNAWNRINIDAVCTI